MREDTAKAALWGVLSGLANLVSIGVLRDSDWYYPLAAVGYGLLLPLIAILHVRQRSVRESGAVLATIAGTAAVAAGIASLAGGGLVVAAVFVRGLWWWTVGKTWAETGILPRPVGIFTMVLAVVAIAVSLATYPLRMDVIWIFEREILGAWTLLVAIALWRSR